MQSMHSTCTAWHTQSSVGQLKFKKYVNWCRLELTMSTSSSMIPRDHTSDFALEANARDDSQFSIVLLSESNIGEPTCVRQHSTSGARYFGTLIENIQTNVTILNTAFSVNVQHFWQWHIWCSFSDQVSFVTTTSVYTGETLCELQLTATFTLTKKGWFCSKNRPSWLAYPGYRTQNSIETCENENRLLYLARLATLHLQHVDERRPLTYYQTQYKIDNVMPIEEIHPYVSHKNHRMRNESNIT